MQNTDYCNSPIFYVSDDTGTYPPAYILNDSEMGAVGEYCEFHHLSYKEMDHSGFFAMAAVGGKILHFTVIDITG